MAARDRCRAEEPPKPKRDDRAKPGDKEKVGAPPAGTYQVTVLRNIAYRDDKDADPIRHRLDLYLPKGQTDFPVLFFVHGGGWHGGNKELYGPFSELLARIGIGAVIINYRLSPQARFPAHIEDVARAFAWAHANIARYGGRTDQIIVGGHSAGGHLISLLVTDERYLKAEKLSVKDVHGVVSVSGVYSLNDIYGMYGSIFGRDRSDRRDASPLSHVHDHEPPFLILYADKDLPTIEKVSEHFYEELKKAKCEARIQKISDRTHLSLMLLASDDNDPAAQAIFDFIEHYTNWKRPALPASKETRKP